MQFERCSPKEAQRVGVLTAELLGFDESWLDDLSDGDCGPKGRLANAIEEAFNGDVESGAWCRLEALWVVAGADH